VNFEILILATINPLKNSTKFDNAIKKKIRENA